MMIAELIAISRIVLVIFAVCIIIEKILGYYCRTRKKGKSKLCEYVLKQGLEVQNTQVRQVKALGNIIIVTYYDTQQGREWNRIYKKIA